MAKLGDLKALLAQAPRRDTKATKPAARKPERAPPHVQSIEPEIDLGQAFADVQRLTATKRARIARPQPSARPVKRLQDEADALTSSRLGANPAPSAWDIGQELEAEQTFLRDGLGTDILVKLRRGHWSVQGELDLHRLTSDEAHDALADFLTAARRQGWRCIRVIHGKGLSSPNREPVLKGKARRWLARWGDVLAYCEAPRHAGGSGAVIVLLRGR